MALFGLGAMSDLSPLSGVKRKSDLRADRSAFDPERTFVPSRILRLFNIRRRPRAQRK
jgi:hypothetical protein